MPSIPKFTKVQLERVNRLEDKLRTAVSLCDYRLARTVMADLDSFLKSTGHNARLMKNRARLFECAIESGDYEFAEKGLLVVVSKTKESTRIHLEAKSLLALSLLRQGRIEEAEPHMEWVLKNDAGIKSDKQRALFKAKVIERFEEEAVMASLINSAPRDRLEPKEIEVEVGKLLMGNVSEEELYVRVGIASPPKTSDYIMRIDAFSRKRIGVQAVKLLPSPEDKMTHKKVGMTVVGALKRRLFAAFCDPDSEVYKAWTKEGIGAVVNKAYIGSAIAVCLADLNAGAMALAVPIAALIFKVGVEAYCSCNGAKAFM